MLYQNPVNHSVCSGIFGGHPVIPVRVMEDLVIRLAAMPGDDVIEFFAALVDLPRFDEDILGLSLDASEWLVDHDTGVGERAAFPLCPGAEEDAAH